MKELDGVPLVSYAEPDVINGATTTQIIAAITATISMTAGWDPLAVHHRVVDGTLTRWLRRIEQLESR